MSIHMVFEVKKPAFNVGTPLSGCVKVNAPPGLMKPQFSHLLEVSGDISDSLSGLSWE